MLHYRLHQDPLSSHQQIARLIRERRPSRILDVGAAQGFLGQLLSGSGLVIDAVEPNPLWAEHGRQYYSQFHVGAVESVPLPQDEYDAIVCADVLEHCPDPAVVLRKLTSLAKENATFIVSVPNVAHLAVRAMLLFGRFPKMDRGILDKTHLHFLTKDTAIDLLQSAGLRVERMNGTGVPLDEVFKKSEGKWWFHLLVRFQHLLVGLMPRLFAMQWVMVAKMTKSETPNPNQ